MSIKIYYDPKHSEIPVFKDPLTFFGIEITEPSTQLLCDVSVGEMNFIILSLCFYQKNPEWIYNKWVDLRGILSAKEQSNTIVLIISDGSDDSIDGPLIDSLSAFSMQERFRVALITSQLNLAQFLLYFTDAEQSDEALKSLQEKHKTHKDRAIDFLTRCSKPGLSQQNALDIINRITTLADLISWTKEDFLAIPGIAEKKAEAIFEFINK